MKVLIVEDDRDLARIMQRALEESLYRVELAFDGESGRFQALNGEFSVILLDLMLPRLDGIAVCNAIREAHVFTPVIMLTARDSVDDRVLGLDAGADDYLVKPFAMKELLARIRAVIRRLDHHRSTTLEVGDLRLDPAKSYVKLGEQKIKLTAKEFALLHFFMQHPDEIVTRMAILENVWDANYDGLGNVVDVYVNYLRNKLKPELIETVRGRGYLLKGSPS